MVLVSASSLQKDFGERSLFGGVSFDISDRDRVGLVGANGAGKSTLFRILTGEYKPDGGTLALSRTAKIGYMEQYIVEDSDRSAFEEMLTVFSSLMEEERALKRIASEIDSAARGGADRPHGALSGARRAHLSQPGTGGDARPRLFGGGF